MLWLNKLVMTKVSIYPESNSPVYSYAHKQQAIALSEFVPLLPYGTLQYNYLLFQPFCSINRILNGQIIFDGFVYYESLSCIINKVYHLHLLSQCKTYPKFKRNSSIARWVVYLLNWELNTHLHKWYHQVATLSCSGSEWVWSPSWAH